MKSKVIQFLIKHQQQDIKCRPRVLSIIRHHVWKIIHKCVCTIFKVFFSSSLYRNEEATVVSHYCCYLAILCLSSKQHSIPFRFVFFLLLLLRLLLIIEKKEENIRIELDELCKRSM
jgi:hypothetical protein